MPWSAGMRTHESMSRTYHPASGCCKDNFHRGMGDYNCIWGFHVTFGCVSYEIRLCDDLT